MRLLCRSAHPQKPSGSPGKDVAVSSGGAEVIGVGRAQRTGRRVGRRAVKLSVLVDMFSWQLWVVLHYLHKTLSA